MRLPWDWYPMYSWSPMCSNTTNPFPPINTSQQARWMGWKIWKNGKKPERLRFEWGTWWWTSRFWPYIGFMPVFWMEKLQVSFHIFPGGVTLPALLAARGVSPQHPQPGWPLIQRALDLWAAMGWDKSFTFNVGAWDLNGAVGPKKKQWKQIMGLFHDI